MDGRKGPRERLVKIHRISGEDRGTFPLTDETYHTLRFDNDLIHGEVEINTLKRWHKLKSGSILTAVRIPRRLCAEVSDFSKPLRWVDINQRRDIDEDLCFEHVDYLLARAKYSFPSPSAELLVRFFDLDDTDVNNSLLPGLRNAASNIYNCVLGPEERTPVNVWRGQLADSSGAEISEAMTGQLRDFTHNQRACADAFEERRTGLLAYRGRRSNRVHGWLFFVLTGWSGVPGMIRRGCGV
jgi:hypothetical protein